jgi:hypothetical protein
MVAFYNYITLWQKKNKKQKTKKQKNKTKNRPDQFLF